MIKKIRNIEYDVSIDDMVMIARARNLLERLKNDLEDTDAKYKQVLVLDYETIRYEFSNDDIGLLEDAINILIALQFGKTYIREG